MKGLSERDYAIDLSKALAIFFVVVWHLQPFIIQNTYPNSHIKENTQFLLNIFYIQISQVAVPTFFLVSLILLFEKIDHVDIKKQTRKRLRRLLSIYLFWTIVQFLFFFGIRLLRPTSSGNSVELFNFNMSPLELVFHGGPPLPAVGGSVFYFLFVLICLSGIAIVFSKVLEHNYNKLHIASGIALLFLCYFQIRNHYDVREIPYWRLDNFLVYVPLAYCLRLKKEAINGWVVLLLIICFVTFAVQDNILRSHFGSTGNYSRVSVVVGALAVYSFFHVYKNILSFASPVVSFLAQYSLGIFALHKYWQEMFTYFIKWPGPIFETSLFNFTAFINAILCLLFTYLSVLVIRRTRFVWTIR